MRLRIRSRLVTLVSAAVTAPILVAMPAPVQATPAPVPVTPTTRSVPLLAPTNPAITAAGRSGLAPTTPTASAAKASATRAGIQAGGASSVTRLLGATAVQPVTSEVAVVGLTWQEKTGGAAVVQIRSRTGTRWSAWQTVESDPTRGDGDASATRAGTDPLVMAGVSAVQARVLGPAGATPAKASLEVIDPGTSSYDGTAGTAAAQPGSAQAVAARPAMNSRASWGANERLRRGGVSYGAVKGVVVHHTAGTNNYTPSQVPAIMRGIYAFHVNGRKWNDIAYNVLVDKWGRIWEGRAGGLENPVAGAHTLGYNGYTMGVSMLGDYQRATPSTAALDSVARIIAYKSGIHEFAPNGVTNLFGTRRPTVVGHRNVGQTTCPGTYLYAKLPWIRSRAAALAGYTPALSLSRDVDHQGGSDVPALRADGRLQLLTARTNGSMAIGRIMGTGWSTFDHVMAAGDVDSDGDADILARHAPTGRLFLYRNTSRGTLAKGQVVGVGWNSFSRIVAPGDITGDGRPDLVAQTATGALRVYPGNGRSGFLRSYAVPGSLPAYRLLVGVGDWDGDRRVELLGVTNDGTAHLLRGVSASGVAETIRLEGNYSSYVALAGVSDTDRDGRTELFAVDRSGNTFLGRRTGTTSVSWSPAGPNASALTVYSG